MAFGSLEADALQAFVDSVKQKLHDTPGDVTFSEAERRTLDDLVRNPKPRRQRMPSERLSRTRKFEILRKDEPPFECYVHVGFFPDGRLGEIFIDADKEGSLTSGAFNAASTAMSMALQYGAPLEPLIMKWEGMRFDPAGPTGDPKHPLVGSALAYIAKWIRQTFPDGKWTELRPGQATLPSLTPDPAVNSAEDAND